MSRDLRWKIVRHLQKWRVKWYRYILSEQKGNDVWGRLSAWQPVQINGQGRIRICGDGALKVIIGWRRSPNYYCGNSYVEARYPSSCISIGEGAFFNNNCTIIANTTSISIGKNCRIGCSCSFFDSDFHGIHPDDRDLPGDSFPDAPVTIGNNVFIGSNVTILKGVTIGDGSIIGAGSVVSKSIPPMSIAAGNPCRVIRAITEADRIPQKTYRDET